MKTHGWNANCAMVLRCSLYFPPYNLRDVWRADKHSYIGAVTHSLELYLSTPTSHTSKLLKMLIECDLSPWHISDPVRLVNGTVALNHFQ